MTVKELYDRLSYIMDNNSDIEDTQMSIVDNDGVLHPLKMCIVESDFKVHPHYDVYLTVRTNEEYENS